MITTITKTKEVEVCDLCGKEDPSIHLDDKYYCSNTCWAFDKYKTVETYLKAV